MLFGADFGPSFDAGLLTCWHSIDARPPAFTPQMLTSAFVVVRDAGKYEAMIKQKQQGVLRFAFLFGEGPGASYYTELLA